MFKRGENLINLSNKKIKQKYIMNIGTVLEYVQSGL